MSNMVEKYTKTYTAFAGCDIVASFNGKMFGELQGITYSISREKAPIYTMGSAEPRAFARGKRGIAGTLVFTVFNRDAMIEEFKDKLDGKTLGIQKFKAEGGSRLLSLEDWDKEMTSYATGGNTNPTDGLAGGKVSDLVGKYQPSYVDEILPFDITITFANEYGQKSVMVIYGVELINEGAGFSMDSVVSEKAYTFVARKIDYMRSLSEDEDFPISATW